MDNSYAFVALLIASAVTWALRVGPFFVFKDREIPEILRYLGDVMPPAIMAILVIYFIRDNIVTGDVLSELIALGLVLIIQLARRNMILSMTVGTLVYMLLIRIM